jgi:flagellar basal body-associated protein FliL
MVQGTRAQAATEYLIILSIVIVIALVVVGAMGGIPRLGSSTSSRTSAAYWQQADVGISASFLNASGARLVVKNNQPFRIRITNAYLKDSTGAVIYSSASSVLLKSGKTQELVLANQSSVQSSGDFTYDASFTYMDADNSLGPYQFTGEQGLVGKYQ